MKWKSVQHIKVVLRITECVSENSLLLFTIYLAHIGECHLDKEVNMKNMKFQ